MRTLVATAALAAFAAAVSVQGQQAPRTLGAASAPVAVIDFAAVDAKGQPVTNLTAADVTVAINGKPREVRGLELITRERPGAASADPLPAPFATNVAAGSRGRSVLAVIDIETIAAGREERVREGLNYYVDQLGPNDEAGLVAVPHGGVTLDLTTDRGAWRAAVAKVAGAAPTTESTDDAACRSRLTLEAMTNLLRARPASGSPLDVLFVSASLSGPKSYTINGTTQLGRGSVAKCDLASDAFAELGRAAASARARIFVVVPDQIRAATTTGLDSPMTGLENVAGVTGGTLFHLAGSDVPPFQRIALETSAYYAATIAVDPSDAQAPTRTLDVKTIRTDVTVHARPSIAFAPATARPAAAPSPKDMLRTATTYRDAGLRMAAFHSKNAGDDKVKIVVLAESVGGNKLSAAAIGVYDTSNKLVAQWSADATALAAPSLMTAFVQNPGKYRIRVAATDAGGRAGTADYDLDATLTPASTVLTLSAMLLGTPDNTFTPKLSFSTEPQAVAYFELYGGKQGMPVSVAVELAKTLNGPAMTTLQPKISATSEAGKYIVMTPIALGALPPGDYIVRAIVGLDGQPAGRTLRTLRLATSSGK